MDLENMKRKYAYTLARVGPVSYTHLDVYKRQTGKCSPISPAESLPCFSRFNISRRMGSAKAFKVFCSATAASFPRHLTFNRIVN